MNSIQRTAIITEFLRTKTLEKLKEIQPTIKELQGEKIQSSNGENFLKKWTLKSSLEKSEKIIDGQKVFFSFQVWYELKHREVSIKTKACINGGNYDDGTAFTVYEEDFNYIGGIVDQCLTTEAHADIDKSIEYLEDLVLKTYTLEDFNQHQREYRELHAKLRELEGEIDPKFRKHLTKY